MDIPGKQSPDNGHGSKSQVRGGGNQQENSAEGHLYPAPGLPEKGPAGNGRPPGLLSHRTRKLWLLLGF